MLNITGQEIKSAIKENLFYEDKRERYISEYISVIQNNEILFDEFSKQIELLPLGKGLDLPKLLKPNRKEFIINNLTFWSLIEVHFLKYYSVFKYFHNEIFVDPDKCFEIKPINSLIFCNIDVLNHDFFTRLFFDYMKYLDKSYDILGIQVKIKSELQNEVEKVLLKYKQFRSDIKDYIDVDIWEKTGYFYQQIGFNDYDWPNIFKQFGRIFGIEPVLTQDFNESTETGQDKDKYPGDGDNGGEDGQETQEGEGKDQGKAKIQSKEYNSSDKYRENNSILSIFNDKSGYRWSDLELVFNVIESEVKVTFKPNQETKKYNIYEDLELPSKGKNNKKPTKATSYFYQILIEGLPKSFKTGFNEKYTSGDRKNLYTINTKLKKAFGLSNNPIKREGQGFLIKFDHNLTGLENNYKQLEQDFNHRKNKVEYDDNIDYKK